MYICGIYLKRMNILYENNENIYQLLDKNKWSRLKHLFNAKCKLDL
jgi:hypothetical protein